MTRIYLVRHAEAEGNLYRIAHGHYNGLITARGYKQPCSSGLSTYTSTPYTAAICSAPAPRPGPYICPRACLCTPTRTCGR